MLKKSTSKCLPGVELSIIVCDEDQGRNPVLCCGMDTVRRVQGMATYLITSPAIFVYYFSECFMNTYPGPSIEVGALRDTEELEIIILALMMLASSLLIL